MDQVRGAQGDPERPQGHGARIPRRRFLQLAGTSAAAVLGARGVLAGSLSGDVTGAHVADALGQDAINTLASSLGYDLTTIFRHVADEVWYEPYSGSLRGARGALESRAGNSVDKAALLAALLQSALFETRFVSGTLDDASASALLATTAVTRDAAMARARSVLTGEPEGSAGPAPSAPAGLPAGLQSIADRKDELVATAQAWASDHLAAGVSTIIRALADAGIPVATPAITLPDLERRRHTWVQARQGADWVDLDPLLPGAEPGVAATAPDGEPFDVIPDDLRHQLRFTVTADVISGDTLAQMQVLDQMLATDTLDAASLLLFHEKPGDLKDLGIAIGGALGGGDPRYQTILQVGSRSYVGDGWLSLSGGDSGPFGGGDGSRDGTAVAEWLDVTVTGPEGTIRTTRRPIFDLVGAKARVMGPIDVASIPKPELLALGPDLTDEFQPLRDLWFVSVATGATNVDGLASSEDRQLDEVASTGLAASLYHVARDGMSAAFALDRGVRTFLDAPNVAAFVIGGRLRDDGSFDVSTRVDLLHRAFGRLGVPDRTVSEPPGVVAGVLSHIVERIQTGEGLPELFAEAVSAPLPLSAGAVIEAAQGQGIRLLVLRDGSSADLVWPTAAAARLTDALAGGWVAIAPANPVQVGDQVRLGWWLVDPATGVTLDMLDDGLGASMVEDAWLKIKTVAVAARPYICLGISVAELAHMAHDLMIGNIAAAGVGAAAGAGAHKLLGCH